VKLNDNTETDQRLYAIPDIHGHAKGEHKPFAEERPIPLSARMLFLWFFHACRRGWPRFVMVSDHMNYLTFEDPAAVNLVRRALKLAQAGDLYGAAETASVEVGHAAVVSEGLRRGMRYSIGAEVDNDPRSRPDAQNIVDAMKPDGMIRSVHFLTIDHPVHGPNWNWAFDNPEFKELFETVGTEKTWELYMTTLLDAIERLPGHIVGHFYVPAVFGHWPDDATLEKYEDQLVDACEARGMAIEFNTRFLYRDHPDDEKQKYIRAHERLMKKAKAKNVGIAIGSDAHSPKDQGGAFTTVLDVLDACEINEIVFPLAGRLARVALKVERKPEPEPPPAPPVPAPVAVEKPVRKARSSESPTRPKESRPQREDETASPDGGSDAAAAAPDAPPAPVRKARPSRAKADKTPPAEASDAPSERVSEATDAPIETPPVKATPKKASSKSAPPSEPTESDAPKPSPVQAVIEKAVSLVKTAAAKIAPAKVTPVKPAPTKAAPLKAESVKAAPVKAMPMKIAPGKAAPVKAALVKAVPIKAAPVKAAPVKAVPMKVVPAKKTAAKTPAPAPKKAAVKAQPAPLKKAPKPVAKAQSAPAKKAPAKKAAPLKKAVVKKAPAKKAPTKKAAAKKAPLKKAPAKKTAAKPAPKRAPLKKTSAKKAPAKKTTAKKSAAKRR